MWTYSNTIISQLPTHGSMLDSTHFGASVSTLLHSPRSGARIWWPDCLLLVTETGVTYYLKWTTLSVTSVTLGPIRYVEWSALHFLPLQNLRGEYVNRQYREGLVLAY